MQFFLDSADLEQIKELYDTGMIDGVTTNPSLIYKSQRGFDEVIRDICELVTGHVSVETVYETSEEMYQQGQIFSEISDNVVVKVPLTYEGLRACRRLSADNIKVNVTLCFSANQALLAAKAGAYYVSPFVGRIDDVGGDGMSLIEEIRHIYDDYDFSTRILAASIRSPRHVLDSALSGAHVATIPPNVFKQLYKHPLTDKGIQIFNEDWQKYEANKQKK